MGGQDRKNGGWCGPEQGDYTAAVFRPIIGLVLTALGSQPPANKRSQTSNNERSFTYPVVGHRFSDRRTTPVALGKAAVKRWRAADTAFPRGQKSALSPNHSAQNPETYATRHAPSEYRPRCASSMARPRTPRVDSSSGIFAPLAPWQFEYRPASGGRTARFRVAYTRCRTCVPRPSKPPAPPLRNGRAPSGFCVEHCPAAIPAGRSRRNRSRAAKAVARLMQVDMRRVAAGCRLPAFPTLATAPSLLQHFGGRGGVRQARAEPLCSQCEFRARSGRQGPI